MITKTPNLMYLLNVQITLTANRRQAVSDRGVVRSFDPLKIFGASIILRAVFTRRDIIGSEFPAICNPCGVMPAWNWNWKFCEQFFAFFGKTAHYCKKFQNVVLKVDR